MLIIDPSLSMTYPVVAGTKIMAIRIFYEFAYGRSSEQINKMFPEVGLDIINGLIERFKRLEHHKEKFLHA